MKITRILIIPIIIILAGTSCQVQAPAAEATAVEALIPAPDSTKLPAEAQSGLINAGNLAQLEKSASLQTSTGAVNCAWSSDGSKFTIMDITHAGLYDAASLSLIGEFTGDEYTALYAVSPDAGLAAYSLDGLTIQVYDFFTKADRFNFKPGYPYSNVFFSPDGNLLAVASLDLIEVVLYDTATGAEVSRLAGFETAAPVYNARFSPDGSYLLWISRGTTQPMDISTQALKPALSHEDFIAAASMSHDNSKVATTAAGTLDGEFQPLVTVWIAQTGEVLWQKGNDEYFTYLEFSPADSLLAVGSSDEVVFFDSTTGAELFRLQTSGDAIRNLAFSPNGQALLTCSRDGVAVIWKVIP